MLVKFNTKEFKISDSTLESMETKIHRRFDKYFANKDENAVFYVKLIDQRKLKEKVELTLPYMGYQLRAEVADKDGIIAALDKGMDIMERQITKAKTKLSRNLRDTPEAVHGSTDVGEPEQEKYAVVKSKKYEMKPMSVQDAILNMDLLGHNFYVFANSDDDDETCVVYRRNDGDYGLIEPLK